ncbi:MAG: Coq4 family protein [Chitinophagaceae bacterium]
MQILNTIKAFIAYFSGDIGNGGAILMRAMGARCPKNKEADFIVFEGQKKLSDSINLAEMPEGSLGKEYLAFLERNNMQEIWLKEELANTHSHHKLFCNRVIIIHDFLHFILNLGFNYVDENTLGAFIESQNPQPCLTNGRIGTALTCMIIRPWKIAQIKNAVKKGHSLGKEVTYLFDIDFSQLWHLPLAEVRKQFSIPVTIN